MRSSSPCVQEDGKHRVRTCHADGDRAVLVSQGKVDTDRQGVL
ncbi:hypothetical protein ACPCIU_02890 [Streptomyces seoulensis]